MADISIRVPDCDDDDCEGERGERGERGKRGHRGHRGHDGRDAEVNVDDVTIAGDGSDDDPLRVIGLPISPDFVSQTIFIFARVTGSDETGDGTLANPFRTMPRAVQEVYILTFGGNVPAGTIYRVDVTGLGAAPLAHEVLPDEYIFPVFTGADSANSGFDFAQPFFHLFAPVNVQADPQLATGVTGSLTITSGVASVTKPSTGLKRITRTDGGAAWIPGELKGKFAIGAGLATNHSVIWDNGVDWIEITRTGTPLFPIRVMEPSARFEAFKNPAHLHLAAVNILNSQMALLGIGVRSTDAGAPGQFSQWGFQAGGTQPPTSLQLCDLRGAGFVQDAWCRVRMCYCPDILFASAPNLIIQSFIHRSMQNTTGNDATRVTVWFGRGIDSLIRQSVIEGTTPLHYRDAFDNFNSLPVPALELQSVQILNTIPEFPASVGGPGDEGPISDGLFWTGVRGILLGVDISRTDGALGSSPIVVKGNHSTLTLKAVTGTGYANTGCVVVDGGNVEVDDAGGAVPTSVVGLNGFAFQSGSLPPEPTWPVAVYPAAGSNFPDYVSLLAQGTRVWRSS